MTETYSAGKSFSSVDQVLETMACVVESPCTPETRSDWLQLLRQAGELSGGADVLVELVRSPSYITIREHGGPMAIRNLSDPASSEQIHSRGEWTRYWDARLAPRFPITREGGRPTKWAVRARPRTDFDLVVAPVSFRVFEDALVLEAMERSKHLDDSLPLHGFPRLPSSNSRF